MLAPQLDALTESYHVPLRSTDAMLEASVIICTRNPRSDYIARVLDGLRNQTLPSNKWELLIIDNGSTVSVGSSCDISWHPSGRHILERELGIAFARQRGIQEASAKVLIFVDDDNVLDESYLAKAIKIGQKCSFLGAWGSGCIRGDFEIEPPQNLRSWFPVREVAAPRWSNLAGSHLFGESPDEAIPWGAGLCVRKDIAVAYCKLQDQSRLQITGRLGETLLGCEVEDTEISFVCCSHGFGVGIFPELKIAHLIPQRRTSEGYIVRFAEGVCLSNILLHYKWQQTTPPSPFSIQTLMTILKTGLLYRGIDRKLRFAWVRAVCKANKIIDADQRRNKDQVIGSAARTGFSYRLRWAAKLLG